MKNNKMSQLVVVAFSGSTPTRRCALPRMSAMCVGTK